MRDQVFEGRQLAHAGRWESRLSPGGRPYKVWVRIMPWISDDILDCAIYLYPSEAAAEDGESIGGSGFIIGVPLSSKHALPCVVTNKHVVDKGNTIVRVNTTGGGMDTIALDNATWFAHPDGDDLAVCPIELGSGYKVRYIPLNMFLTKEKIEQFDIGPGDEIYVVGRFVNHEGRQKNLPSVRFGNIAQMPWEPIFVDGREQESFLVEAKSIAGYSGSPVFVYLPVQLQAGWGNDLLNALESKKFTVAGINPKRVRNPLPVGPWLLGIDYCHTKLDEPIWSAQRKEPVSDDWYVRSNTGLMGVIPAWRLAEIVEGPMKPVIEKMKDMVEKATKKDGEGVELDRAQAKPNDSIDENPEHERDFNQLLQKAATHKNE